MKTDLLRVGKRLLRFLRFLVPGVTRGTKFYLFVGTVKIRMYLENKYVYHIKGANLVAPVPPRARPVDPLTKQRLTASFARLREIIETRRSFDDMAAKSGPMSYTAVSAPFFAAMKSLQGDLDRMVMVELNLANAIIAGDQPLADTAANVVGVLRDRLDLIYDQMEGLLDTLSEGE